MTSNPIQGIRESDDFADVTGVGKAHTEATRRHMLTDFPVIPKVVEVSVAVHTTLGGLPYSFSHFIAGAHSHHVLA
jgi:hypothetical protein